jgi:hypothetical protein
MSVDAPRRGRWLPAVSFLVQLVVTAVVMGLLSIAVVFGFTYNPLDVLAFFNVFAIAGSLVVRTLLALVAAMLLFALTGLIVGILGLPVRIVPSWRRAWLGNGEWTVAGVVLGGALLITGVLLGHPSVSAFGGPAYQPEPWTMFVGWILLAFSLSMFVWPVRWMSARARAWWEETQLHRR